MDSSIWFTVSERPEFFDFNGKKLLKIMTFNYDKHDIKHYHYFNIMQIYSAKLILNISDERLSESNKKAEHLLLNGGYFYDNQKLIDPYNRVIECRIYINRIIRNYLLSKEVCTELKIAMVGLLFSAWFE